MLFIFFMEDFIVAKIMILYYISMPEGTIFQDGVSDVQNNPTNIPQSQNESVVNEKKHSRFSPRGILKIGFLIFLILTVVFIASSIINRGNRGKTEEVTISYWGVNEDPEVINPVISDFEKKNPNIKVSYSQEDIIDYREKLTTRIENGNGPDVFMFHNTWYPIFKNNLSPLTQETISKEEFTKRFYNVNEDDLIKNGAIYGIPLEMDTLALFINTAIIESASKSFNRQLVAPKTWQEFIDLSEVLTKRDETGKIVIGGAAIGTYDNIKNAPDLISLLFAQNGVNIKKPNEFVEKISDALTFYTTFALNENSVWDVTLEPSMEAFSQGKVAMIFGYHRDFVEIKSKNSDLDFRVYPVPQLLQDSKANIASYWVNGVSSKSLHQKESMLFMKFLLSEETQRKIYEQQLKKNGLGKVPAGKSLIAEFKNSDIKVFSDQGLNAVSSPFADSTFDSSLNLESNKLLQESINSILQNENVDSASGSIIDGLNYVFQKLEPQPTVKK